MFRNYNLPPYDIIQGDNDSLILDIAVPGFRREDLECTFEDDVLNIKSVTNPLATKKVLRQGIKSDIDANFTFQSGMKIDMITIGDGILRVLASKILPLPNNSKYIQIQ